MMFSKVFYLYLTINLCGAEDVLENLYKSHNGSRATACVQVQGGRTCAGLIWRQHWMLTHASCVLDYPFASINVKKGIVNCSHDMTTPATIAIGELSSRNVVTSYKHPLYPEVDLALLRLDWPYTSTELIDNRTISNNILNKLDIWMKNILFTENMHKINTRQVGYKNHLKMYSTPVRMFLATVVLPSASFIVFFLFIIFFTGKNKGNKIPYRNLNDKKETTYV